MRGIKVYYILILIAIIAISSIGLIAFRQDNTDNQLKQCQEITQFNKEDCAYIIENHVIVVKEPTKEGN